MAGYKITSDKGKEIAKNLSTGGTYKASDGSTWTKNNDGSVSVTTKSGDYTANAFGGSTGGSSVGTSGAKSLSSPSNSTGGSTDYSVLLKDLLGKNAGNYNPDIVGQVQSLFDQRSSKINADPNLYKYANDDLMIAAQNYLSGAKNYQQTQDMLAQIAEMTKQPQYQSPIQGNMLDMVNGIANRPGFKYNHLEDPSWQAYATQFGILGDQAMADTLGDVSGMTGGLPSSYAVTAAAQAKNQYNQKMTDIIPTLMNAAYQRYQAGIDTDMSLAGLMGNIDSNMYNQYSNTRAQNMDAARWLADYGYNASRDQVADKQWREGFDYTKQQDQQELDKWLAEFNEAKRQAAVDEMIAKGQLSVSQGNLALSRVKYKDSKDAVDSNADWTTDFALMMEQPDPYTWLRNNASEMTSDELEWLEERWKEYAKSKGTSGLSGILPFVPDMQQ